MFMKEKIMARPKQIEDDVLLDLIKKFFNDECRGNIKKLKASEKIGRAHV